MVDLIDLISNRNLMLQIIVRRTELNKKQINIFMLSKILGKKTVEIHVFIIKDMNLFKC